MHDLRAIRDNPEAFDAGLARRGLDPLSPAILDLDQRRRAVQTSLQEMQARRNEASKLIGAYKKEGRDAQPILDEVAALKERIPAAEEEDKRRGEELDALLAGIPNIPAADVPDGKDEHDNVEVRRVGTPPAIATPRQHFELGESLGLMDFEGAAKLSGARFTVLKGGLARLERALGDFMLDLHTREFGYTEVSPPLLVRDEAMFGTAQLPKFREDQFGVTIIDREELSELFNTYMYHKMAEFSDFLAQNETAQPGEVVRFPPGFFDAALKTFSKVVNGEKLIDGDLKEFAGAASKRWLIPTAEVPLTNLLMDAIVDADELPLRMTARTPCFRAEAGAAGRDTRGMIRQHQFIKVELVSVTRPDQSDAEHERMTEAAETVLKRLGLPFRTVTLCTGDMGFASRKTYDIEVWLPGQGAYREISSCSNCGEFQARRMKARWRVKGEKGTQFVHTLNGSGVAVGRCLIAVMENYQQPDGSIAIPDALKPYMGGIDRIAAPARG